MTKELKDPFQPAHELIKQSVIMVMHLVNKLVEVVFVSCTKIDERLHCLIRIGGDVLSLACFNDPDHIIDECSKVSNAVVDICRLINSDQGFVEDGEQVAEEL